ncbi:MAG TPA: thiamine pyrophosphate-binding protein [Caulobacteraceae bacterium]|jgi:acetolactate synthase-1/2/3 large subunit
MLSADERAQMAATRRTAGRALVDQLAIQGVEHVFCVPGESYLAVLDALYDSHIQMTVCRQEGGAAMMAEAVGKATGRPGVCFVTRGPGATNAMAGVHIAQHDSTPMIMFAGLVESGFAGRGAWQEFDLRSAFAGMAKWVTELDNPDRIAEVVSRAFRVATSGRPGPVVIGMPRDVLDALSASPDGAPVQTIETGPDATEIDAFHEMISNAERPMVIVGGSRWSEDARAAMHRFAERFELPVATSYRRGPLFDPGHRCYAGDLGLGANPALVRRIKDADVVALIGGRLGEVPSQGYTLFDIPAPGLQLIHVYPEAEEIGRVHAPKLAIQASPNRFAAALDRLTPPSTIARRGQAAAAHAGYLAWSGTPTPQPGPTNLGEIMVWLREQLPADSIICNGAGAYAAWLHRYYRFRGFNSHIAPTSASMGYGVPAAVAMKRLFPERQVVSINGDGDFLMNGQEFATAVQYGLPIVVLVLDNASYGSIRLSQEREYPGRVYATDLKNPDFAALARAFGGFGATVERTEDFADAFRAAQASGLPSILHVKVDADAIGPTTTLSQVRAAALAKQTASA